jgi:hypothetical protein
MRSFSGIVWCFLFLMLCACGTHAELYNDSPKSYDVTGFQKDSLRMPWLDYTYFTAKYQVKITQGKEKHTLQAQLKYVKGQNMMISVQKSGIQVFKFLASPDSLTFVDYFQNEYLSESFASLSEQMRLPVCFSLLEKILLGAWQIDSLQEPVFRQGPVYYFKPKTHEKHGQMIETQKAFSNQNYLPMWVHLKLMSKQTDLFLHYQYDLKNISTYPLQINAELKGSNIPLIISLKNTNFANDKKPSFSIKIPSDYKRVSYQE